MMDRGCPTLIDQLTRRGVRADETTEGHGLGLAIAKDMIRLYGGQIAFSRSESLGRLRVQVELCKARHQRRVRKG
jgi:signal transduction histidine kinase